MSFPALTQSWPHVDVLGCRVHIVGAADAAAQMADWIERRDGRCRFVVCTGFHGLWTAHQDGSFRAIVNAADLFCPDGIAAVWLARWRGAKLTERATGTEVMKAFLAAADQAGYRSFFYGDTAETLAALRRQVERQYPGHRVVGTFSPPFRPLTPGEDEHVIETIRRARPDVLWVALGLPKQERWIHRHLDCLPVPVAVGVGAAFGFVSGRVRRAPKWMGRIGLEWLWRLGQEPRKLWRRDLVDGPRFLAQVLLKMCRRPRR